jgi:Nitroreductase
MRYAIIVALVAFCLVSVVPVAFAAQTTPLPAPQKNGGKALFSAIEDRASATQSSFPTGAISKEDLSTILWAASGRSRKGSAWTVPTARGYDPYASIFVLGRDGAYSYNGKNHSLTKISGEDLIANVSGQSFATKAPYVLLFVSKLGSSRDTQFGHVLVGSMTQNVYLACDALGIGARYMATLNGDMLKAKLGLGKDDDVVCIMPMGKL